MTHSLDFAGVDEKLFLLQQLILASQPYCRISNICQGSYPYGDDDWNDYNHKIKPVVCGYLIEIAAKVRILEDTSRPHARPSTFVRANRYATEDIPLGTIHRGNFDLTVREACNKIIHATRVELDWITRNSKSSDRYTHWTGKVHLHGERGKDSWHLELDVHGWTVAVDTYIEEIICSEDTQALNLR
jgi:hypothetical protein